MPSKDPRLWDAFQQQFPYILDTFLSRHSAILKCLMEDSVEGMPNMLLYGFRQFPIDMLWREAMRRRFGDFTLMPRTYEKLIPYHETPYFFEIDLANPNLPKDLSCLPDFVKTIVSAKCIHSSRHIIVIRNVDCLRDRQPFRVLMERFSQNAVFICTSYKLAALESPLQSRFFLLRIPAPSRDENHAVLSHLSKVVNGGGNSNEDEPRTSQLFKVPLLKAIALFDAPILEKPELLQYNFPPLLDLLRESKPSLEKIRQMSYKIFQANISLSMAAQDIITFLTKSTKTSSQAQTFLAKAAELEQSLASTQKGRAPLYYERLLHLALTS